MNKRQIAQTIIIGVIILVALIALAPLLNPGTSPDRFQEGRAIGSQLSPTQLTFNISYMPEGVKITECTMHWSWNNKVIASEEERYDLHDSIERPLRFIHGDFTFTVSYSDNNANGLVDEGDFVVVDTDMIIEAGYYNLVIVYNGANDDYSGNIIVSRLNV